MAIVPATVIFTTRQPTAPDKPMIAILPFEAFGAETPCRWGMGCTTTC